MIKAALQYIEDLRKERIIESNGMRNTAWSGWMIP